MLVMRKIILIKIAFNPRSKGLPNDAGYIIKSNRKYRVIDVYLNDRKETIIHVLETKNHELTIDDYIKGIINWNRRYKIMQSHTATHILASIMCNEYGTLIIGGHIFSEYSYDDYSLDAYDSEILEKL